MVPGQLNRDNLQSARARLCRPATTSRTWQPAAFTAPGVDRELAVNNSGKHEDRGSQNAAHRILVGRPRTILSDFEDLLSRKPDENLPPGASWVYALFDGTRLIDIYNTADEADRALQAEFERQHPDVPFTPEVALHGKDDRGETLWSFAVVAVPIEYPSIQEARKRGKKNAALLEKLEHRKKHPRTKVHLVGEEGPDDVLQVATLEAVSRHPDRWQWCAESFAAPPVSLAEFSRNLQSALSDGQKALLGNPNDPRRNVILAYLVRRSGNNLDKLKLAVVDWERGKIPAPNDRDNPVRQCSDTDCGQLYVAQPPEDTGRCPDCNAALRQEKHRKKKKLEGSRPASERAAKAPPKHRAMSNLQLLRARGERRDEDEHGDGSSWGGETLADAEALRDWQRGPDETPEPEFFDDDEQLLKLAERLERENRPDKARQVREFMRSKGRHA
jgi:hypothetical protein